MQKLIKVILKTIKFWIPALIVIAFVHGLGLMCSETVIAGMRNTGDTVLAKDTYTAEMFPYLLTAMAAGVAIMLFISYIKDRL